MAMDQIKVLKHQQEVIEGVIVKVQLKIVNQNEAFSDFNFNSFYSWNTQKKHQLSTHNGNLITIFSDYVTGEPFYSIFGTNNIESSLNLLLDFLHENNLPQEIRLVPEQLVEDLQEGSSFQFESDENNDDYVFSVEELASLKGNRFKSKRRAAKKCAELPLEVKMVNTLDEDLESDIFLLIDEWGKSKGGDSKDFEFERIAISRLLSRFDDQEMVLLTCAFWEGRLFGFSIDELLPHKFALSHFFKTTTNITGLSEHLNQTVANTLVLYL